MSGFAAVLFVLSIGLLSCSSKSELVTTPGPTDPVAPQTPVATPSSAELEVKTAMSDYVRGQTGRDGTLEIKVLQDGQAKPMKLKFIKMLEPVAVFSKASAMACSQFKDAAKGKRSKKIAAYDIDFWFAPGPEGRLVVIPERTEVHKVNDRKLFDYDRSGNKIPVDTNT